MPLLLNFTINLGSGNANKCVNNNNITITKTLGVIILTNLNMHNIVLLAIGTEQKKSRAFPSSRAEIV